LHDQGVFFAPTILADVTPDMAIMNAETFGPVMLLCRVRDDAHAIEVANGTPFGLSASVFSRNLERAGRLVSEIESGMIAVNEFGGATYMAQSLTFGGVKASGYGRINGREGLRACCNTRAVLEDRFPLPIVNKVFPASDKNFHVTRGVIDVLYGRSWRQRVRGVKRILSSLTARS